MTTALVVNAYSVRNRGDAAIAEALMADLHRAGADHVIVAPRAWAEERAEWLALGADEVAPALLSLHGNPRWARPRPVLAAYLAWRLARSLLASRVPFLDDAATAAYRRARLVVSVGGAYLGGPKVGINLVKGFNIAYARFASRPMILAPMTINPVTSQVGRLLRFALRGARIFVRDDPSQGRLAALGLPSEVVPDLAFRTPSAVAAAAALDPAGPAGDGAETILAWAPRDYRPDQDAWDRRAAVEAACVTAVGALLDEDPGLRVCFVPQVTATADDDRVAIRRLAAELIRFGPRIEIAEAPETPGDAVRLLAPATVLLTSRMHAGLLAMLAGVPAVMVGYEPKVAGVLGPLGLLDRVMPVDGSWDGARLAATLRRLMTEPERARTRAAAGVADERFGPFDAALVAGLAA